MNELTIATIHKRQVIDFTDQVESLLDNSSGVAQLFVSHTTAALTTADLDPGTDLDLLDFLEALTPDLKWRHPHDPKHAPDHLISTIIGPSVSVPYEDGKLLLGTWQRLVLIELDGPRQRKVIVSLIKES